MSISEPFVVKNDEPENKSGKQMKPTIENPEESQHTAFHNQTTKPHQLITQKTKHEHDSVLEHDSVVQEQTSNSTKQFDIQSKEEEEEEKEVDEEDEGFRTPTSFDYKIPVIKNCPPAPRKPKTLIPPVRNTSTARRGTPVFLPDEVAEWMISSSILLDFHRKIKKARTLTAD